MSSRSDPVNEFQVWITSDSTTSTDPKAKETEKALWNQSEAKFQFFDKNVQKRLRILKEIVNKPDSYIKRRMLDIYRVRYRDKAPPGDYVVRLEDYAVICSCNKTADLEPGFGDDDDWFFQCKNPDCENSEISGVSEIQLSYYTNALNSIRLPPNALSTDFSCEDHLFIKEIENCCVTTARDRKIKGMDEKRLQIFTEELKIRLKKQTIERKRKEQEEEEAKKEAEAARETKEYRKKWKITWRG